MAVNKKDKIIKIANIECSPCDNGIIINAARQICIISDKLATNRTCHDLHEAVVLGSMDTKKYLNSVKRICTEKQAKESIDSLLNTNIITPNK